MVRWHWRSDRSTCGREQDTWTLPPDPGVWSQGGGGGGGRSGEKRGGCTFPHKRSPISDNHFLHGPKSASQLCWIGCLTRRDGTKTGAAFRFVLLFAVGLCWRSLRRAVQLHVSFPDCHPASLSRLRPALRLVAKKRQDGGVLVLLGTGA